MCSSIDITSRVGGNILKQPKISLKMCPRARTHGDNAQGHYEPPRYRRKQESILAGCGGG